MTVVLGKPPTGIQQTALERSVLHVEDDIGLQELYRELLERLGFSVAQADNLQDAENLARGKRFDIYLVDGQFPLEPNGYKVDDAGLKLYERVRQMHSGDLTYIIFSSNEELERVCRERDIRFLSKGTIWGDKFQAYFRALQ